MDTGKHDDAPPPADAVRRSPWVRLGRYTAAVLITGAALALQLAVWTELRIAPFLLFHVALVLSSWVGGAGPGVTCLVLSTLAVNWFFLSDRHSFSLEPDALGVNALFVLVGSVVIRVMVGEKRSVRVAEEARDQLARALADLEAQERFLRVILDQLPVAVMIQRRNGTALLWSERAKRLFIAPPAAVERALRSEATRGEEIVVDTADGPQRVLAVNAEPVRDAHGEVVAAVALFDDVTEQRRYENERAKRTELEQQLVGIVSHDLRNPLHTIMLAAQLILMQEENDERTLRAGSRILANVEKAQRLIGDLLDFTQARLGGGIPVRPSPHDLHRLVKQTLDDVRLAWPDRGIIHEAAGDAQGTWDGDRVGQIVQNLVLNALRYSPRESQVVVRTRGEGDAVVLEVHNEGPAIPPALLPDLFEPLKRGAHGGERAGGRSVGLGLFIVRQLATAHGGSVDVTTSETDGTTFHVVLPRHSKRTAAPAEAAVQTPTHSS